MTAKRTITLLLAAAVLILATTAILWLKGYAVDAPLSVSLAARLPFEIEGWQGKDLPLGPGELGPIAEKALNPTDYLFREYSHTGERVFVYAMFWRQGRISVREMAGHTPDGCWVANGASLAKPPNSAAFRIGGNRTSDGELRTFNFSDKQRADVAWWHVWGDRLVAKQLAERSIWAMVGEVREWLVHNRGQRRDQWLIRIHVVDGDLERAMDSPPVHAFAKAVPIIFEAKNAR